MIIRRFHKMVVGRRNSLTTHHNMIWIIKPGKTLLNLRVAILSPHKASSKTETQSVPVTIVTHSHPCLCANGARGEGEMLCCCCWLRLLWAVCMGIKQYNRFVYISGFPADGLNNSLLHGAALSCLSVRCQCPLFTPRRYQLWICFSLFEKMDMWQESVWKVSIA